MAAEVSAELERVGDGEVCEVLVAEGHNLTLCDIPGKLVLSGIREAAELDARDLCADGGSEVIHFDALGKELGIGCVGILSVVVMGEGLERRVLLC